MLSLLLVRSSSYWHKSDSIGPVSFTFAKLQIGMIATVFDPEKPALICSSLSLAGCHYTCFCVGGAISRFSRPKCRLSLVRPFVYAGLTSYLIHQNSGLYSYFPSQPLCDSLSRLGILSLRLQAMPLDKALAVGVLPFILPAGSW